MTRAKSGAKEALLESGQLHFSVEAKLLRELGERLVKQPEVALLELIKNAHDADATACTISVDEDTITISDDGCGMTLDEFVAGWMKVGTSAKSGVAQSRQFGRKITGEKGIGRFAVRFLGGSLIVRTVADDPSRGGKTALEAAFDWAKVDEHGDMTEIGVPFELREATAKDRIGTTLTISDIRVDPQDVDWKEIRTSAIPLLSPIQALLASAGVRRRRRRSETEDPGFSLTIQGADSDDQEREDVAAQILESYVLRATLELTGKSLDLKVFQRPEDSASAIEPELEVRDQVADNLVGDLRAEIRFFPKRKGSFAGLPVDGRRALGWVSENSGVAVYDRIFRVLPYGTQGDDWLGAARDTARRHRHPRSPISMRHFPMTPDEAGSTELNYMLRLPAPQQLVGVVMVESARTRANRDERGLIPSADREGFVDNSAFQQLYDVVRGAVEAIAYVDRQLQRQRDEARRKEALASLKEETREAIEAIEANPRLRPADKKRLIAQFTKAQESAETHESVSRRREEQLEVLSLLGVLAGFMTHEFGVALDALERGHAVLLEASGAVPEVSQHADSVNQQIKTLKDFAAYSRAYVGASADRPERSYKVQPRLRQIARVFGGYAADRGIDVEIDAARDLEAPLVPVALYNGIALNLYTNALKAIVARADDSDRRIAFRAWNDESSHVLLVADTGVGIPASLRDRVFDPLVTTTASNTDPLGSGMGLGLTLVRRAVESFGGKVGVVDAPPGFTTAVEVKIPSSID